MRRGAGFVLAALLLVAAAATNDPLSGEQWHLEQVQAPQAWQAARGGGLVVAVLDTGVDLDHPDLTGQLVAGVDLIDPGTPPDDEHGHGTLVAGIVAAATDNGVGVAGTAPGARIMPVRVLDAAGSGRSATVVAGIRYAVDNGAAVVNLSLAGEGRSDGGLVSLVTSDVEDAIREASRRGVVVVAAAGNNARADTPYSMDLPALIVGASDRRDVVWPASNRDGRTLFAPGVEIASTWAHEPGYARGDGTSFAAPIVSAGAVMLRALGLSEAQVRQRLTATAVPIGAGLGRVDLAAAAGVRPGVPDGPPSPPPPAQPPPSAPAPVAAAPTPAPTRTPLSPAVVPEPEPQAAAPPARAVVPPVEAAAPARLDQSVQAGAPRQAPRRAENWLVGLAVVAVLGVAAATAAELAAPRR